MENINIKSMLNRNTKSKAGIQKFGGFLAGMVIMNIGAFIAWGLITAFFIPTGWIPNEYLAKLVGPMINYLLPILIGYTGGKLVHDVRGGVVGAIATAGIIVGSSIPMLLGAMIIGPFAGWVIKKFDDLLKDKVPTGFEMLVDTFSAGILGMLLSLLAYTVIGPFVEGFSNILSGFAAAVTKAGLLPLISIVIEPGKILFMNNAMNHGILAPLGVQQVKEAGKSIFFLLESNPGPGLGVLAAYWLYGKGSIKQSAPGAIIIHFLGGIHEIYFPFVLMKPLLVLAVIGGGMAADLTFVLFKAGLVATPSPGSIFAELAMTPKGGFIPVILGITIGAVVSFLIAAVIVKNDKTEPDDAALDAAKQMVSQMKAESKGKKTVSGNAPKLIVFACEAGMGSSAMGESILKKKIKEAGLEIGVKHFAVNQIPKDADVIFTQESLADRAAQVAPDAEVVTIKNFLDNTAYDDYIKSLKK